MRVIVISSDIKHVSGIRFPESIELSMMTSSSETVVQLFCKKGKPLVAASTSLPVKLP